MPRENINAGSSALSGMIANAQAMQNTTASMTQGIQQGLNSAMSYFSEYRDHLLKRRQLEEQTKANKDLLLEKARQFDTQHVLNQRQMAINEKVGKAQAWNMNANANATHEQTKQMKKDFKLMDDTRYKKDDAQSPATTEKDDTQTQSAPSSSPATQTQLASNAPANSSQPSTTENQASPAPLSSQPSPSPATEPQPSPATQPQPAQSPKVPWMLQPLLAARKNTQDLPTQRF
ncbi:MULTISPECIES: hypothetical protein [unclassified Campylobacter]|uniref:hypothetical protein n=1 Tax=unclassified Campylobacter TaxID=2593542 RepID=UPI00115E6797|nr:MULTISPECIES: hypothetical protein [unclassified Campylobacter]NDJ26383.1 hypothetical protein [Campylobacter sp. MIT 19-121]